jgi:CelD/BcsL family acetyltransferase involved in cellulose biosynthesis
MTVERAASIEPLACRWDELADRLSAAPWMRPGWIAAWWAAFGRGRLELLVARRGDRLVGVIPVQRRHGELRSAANWESPGCCLLAEDAATRRDLAQGLLGARSRRVSLYPLPETGAELQESAQVARAAGYRVLARPILRSPYLPVDGDWAAYERRLSAKKLRELRRRRRRLERHGQLRLEVCDGSERLDELLAEGWRVEASGWKGTRGTAIASRADTRRFYGTISRWAAARGTLRLAFLRLAGRAIAFDLCLEEDRIHYLLKTGYDPALAEFGPGMLIRHEMLARAFRAGLRSYEFLGADNPWKLEWTNQVREKLLLQAFAPSPVGLIDWSAWTYGRPVVRRLRALRSA